MAGSNKNELPFDKSNEVEAPKRDMRIETNDAPPPEQDATPAETPAEETGGHEIDVGEDDGSEDGEDTGQLDGDNPDAGEDFQPGPTRAGEFVVRLSRLGEWQHHPKRGSRFTGPHANALALSASDGALLPPIVVLPEVEGIHRIVDGRFVWAAIKALHDGNEDVEVRCILFDGDEKEAVVAVCDTALGTIGASAIEQAQALLSLTQTNGISRTAIANRYAGLTISKVSNMLIAAETKAAYPPLFDILHEPDRAPISYGVELNKVRKAMGEAFQTVLDRAVDLAADNERCRPAEAFDALQIERVVDADAPEPAPPRPKTVVPVTSEPIMGHDDLPVAAYERLADNVDRIRLPDASAMTLQEREAAAEACIVQIRRHFGLEVQG